MGRRARRRPISVRRGPLRPRSGASSERAEAAGVQVRMPPLRFCTDNGAQIAAIGSELVAAGLPPSDWDFSPDSGMELTTTYLAPRA